MLHLNSEIIAHSQVLELNTMLVLSEINSNLCEL